jgi:anaerobic magnesium-protoporphyrin IX monomethyl ester cyclase
MMEALAEAGCARVFFGIDGGDDEVLSRISKGIRIAEAEQVLRAAAGYFDVTASFIWGYPFEAWPAFERMMVMVRRLRHHEGRFPIWPQIHLLSPSAGTPLFEKYGHTLLLDESVELLPVGTRLDSYDHRPEYAEVRAMIASDKVLAAPFWRYPTPDFERKLLAVEHFNRDHDAEVGARVLRELETLEPVC